MEPETKTRIAGTLGPVIPAQRIEALDVVRGFALIGVLLMNVEFFNRTTHGIGEGMAPGLTGVDWAASWFVAYFVQGKFWTTFSLLFGMGFAVMLTRAERAQSGFLRPYLRRIGALAVIGAAHYIFLWNGDILFSYAVGAGALLILLYGRWRYILIALVPLSGVALIPGFKPAWGIVASLASMGLYSLYLRSERRVTIRGRSLPLFSFLLLVLGTAAAIGAAVLWSLPDGPREPRVPVTVASIAMLVVAYLATKFRNPVELRGLRLGLALYGLGSLTMLGVATVQYLTPGEPVTAQGAVRKRSTEPPAKGDAKKPQRHGPSQARGMASERAKRLAKREREIGNEVRILTRGGYLEAVEMRALKFPTKLASDASFAVVLVALFLLGAWFIRSGVMEHTRDHLALFRRLALIGLPVGIGLGLLGSLIAVSRTPGDDHDGFFVARALSMLGNLPACLGYVGMVVCMLHSRSPFARIRVLAPFGRMALTNYLMQSVICTLAFYGYGLGHWGMSRAWQLVFAVVVLSLQIAFSHWWLARYRFGPLEWWWRGFTYRKTPPMRHSSSAG